MSSYARYSRTVTMTEGDFLKKAVEDLGFKYEPGKEGATASVKQSNGQVIGSFSFADGKATYQSAIYDDARVVGSSNIEFNSADSFLNAVVGSYNLVEAEVKMLERGYHVVSREVSNAGIRLQMGGR